MEKSIKLKSYDPINLFGVSDVYLKLIELEFSVSIIYRNEIIKIKGDKNNVNNTLKILNEMIEILNKKGILSTDNLKDLIQIIKFKKIGNLNNLNQTNLILFEGKNGQISPRTMGQIKCVKSIRNNDIVFLTGPAGTGKTFLSIVSAVSLLQRNEVEKLILCRPAVEAGESLGFLPGDLKEKVDPYLTPLYESLEKILPKNKLKNLLLNNIIEIIPLAYMRGRTLENSFMILDEAQNSTITQMKMFLTRLGIGSKAVITGDITQLDLKRKSFSGLIDVLNILNNIKGIGFVKMGRDDIVRHALVKDIISAYDEKK
tara:strand:+ start:79 stop:1023 length:945 start_codon:yes stop_codon:yes gene_type:complete